MHITNFNENVGKLRTKRADKEIERLNQLYCIICLLMQFESKRVDIVNTNYFANNNLIVIHIDKYLICYQNKHGWIL